MHVYRLINIFIIVTLEIREKPLNSSTIASWILRIVHFNSSQLQKAIFSQKASLLYIYKYIQSIYKDHKNNNVQKMRLTIRDGKQLRQSLQRLDRALVTFCRSVFPLVIRSKYANCISLLRKSPMKTTTTNLVYSLK